MGRRKEKEKLFLHLFRKGLANYLRALGCSDSSSLGACWEIWPFGRKHSLTDKEALCRDLVGVEGYQQASKGTSALVKFTEHLHFMNKYGPVKEV